MDENLENNSFGQSRRADADLTETRRTLPISLLRTRELIMEFYRPLLHAHGLTEQQWRVLRTLHENGCTDASTVAQRACILAPSVSRMVKNLEAAELISISKDPADGRRSMLALAPKGEALIKDIAPDSKVIRDNIREIIGAERSELLLNLLSDIRDDLKSATKST